MQEKRFETIEIADVLYKTVDGIDLYLDIIRPRILPTKAMPVIIYIHGGGWMNGDRKESENGFLAGNGFFAISIQYRLSAQAIFPAQIEDIKDAVRWLHAHAEEYHIDPERIGVWGHSAGGHLAALLGTSADATELVRDAGAYHYPCHVQAVVDLSGPSDLLQMGGWHNAPDSAEAKLLGGPVQKRTEVARLANPITYINQDVPPFLLIHGTEDTVVPISQAELLYVALKAVGADVTFTPLDGENHSFGAKRNSWSKIHRMVQDFFEKHLRG